MFRFLFLIFLLVPIIEIYFLIQIGGWIGGIPTVMLVVFTAVLGALLVRAQGLETALKVRMSMERGQLPAIEMLEGVVLLLSGALLLTPGFFTDLLGFLALVPPLRQLAIRKLISRMNTFRPAPPSDGPVTIEGEFRREEDEK